MKETRLLPIRSVATVWLLTFLPALALTLYSFTVQFIPGDRYLELFQIPALLIAVLLASPIALFHLRSNVQILRIRATLQKIFVLLLAVPLLAIVLWQGLLIGVPSIAHHFAPSEETTREFTVTRAAPAYYSVKFGRCTGRVYLDSNVPLLRSEACGVAKREWRRISPGDKIELHGNASWFGLKYSSARVRND